MSSPEKSIHKVGDPPGPSWIQHTEGVCGGRACIRQTRITVWGLVEAKRTGLSDLQILNSIDGITPSDLDAAWRYYQRRPDEIDQDIVDNSDDE